MQNHVIDPTYFWDAIEEFSFNYDLFVNTSKETDDYGKVHLIYTQQVIRGSLQADGTRVNRSKSGNIDSKAYKFYCKSLYQIQKNDILRYNNNYYIVNSIDEDYNEYGVRAASLETIQLNQYSDLAKYIKYLEGEILV